MGSACFLVARRRPAPGHGQPIGLLATSAFAALLALLRRSPTPAPRPAILFSNELANFLRPRLANPSPAKMPQAKTCYPQMVFTLVDGDEDLILSGPCGLAWRRYQIDCKSPVFADAEALAERLRQLLRTYRGPMGRLVVTNIVRHKVASSIASPPSQADPATMFKFTSEYTFYFRQ